MILETCTVLRQRERYLNNNISSRPFQIHNVSVVSLAHSVSYLFFETSSNFPLFQSAHHFGIMVAVPIKAVSDRSQLTLDNVEDGETVYQVRTSKTSVATGEKCLPRHSDVL